MEMTIRETIEYCVWLNMHGKHQNRTVAPFDVRFAVPRHINSTNHIVVMLPVALVLVGTGIPLRRMLNTYATWGALDFYLACMCQRAILEALQHAINPVKP